MITEEIIIGILNHISTITDTDNLVISGGVGLNSVCNGKLISKTKFNKIWIQSDAGDGGSSLGASVYINHLLGKNCKFDNASLGPEYNFQLKDFLKGKNYYEFKSEEELIETTARLIYENKVVGWFQGRMEYGPRALGNRSILANPMNKKAKEILNLKVKHREEFRPFAPVIRREDANVFFECDFPLPEITDYMLIVYPIKEKWREIVPSVTHVDGSGRLQTIREEQNKLYYNLISRFGKISGTPILINTSFNIRGEPIVCTPNDAYKCMMGTGIDCLVIGNFLIKRNDNLKDEWDSEKYAKD